MSLSNPYLVWEEAVQYLEAQGDKPGLFGGYRIYYNLGNANLEAGYVREALKDYDKAIALKPSYAYAHHQRGRVFLLQDELEKARAEFELAIN